MTALWCLYFLFSLHLVSGTRVKRQYANYCFPRLQPPRNGYFTVQCPNTIGSSCTVACTPGSVLIGESQVTCMPDTRTWNAPLPLCVPNPVTSGASSITQPAGGYYPGVVQPGIVIGPAVGYLPSTMIPGTTIPGAGAATSIQIMCPVLSAPANGIRSGNCERAMPGTTCLFSCMPGFVLSGYPILTCGSSGQWTPQVPPMCMNQQPVYPPVYPGSIPINSGNGCLSGSCGISGSGIGGGGMGGGGGGVTTPFMTTTRPPPVMTTMVPVIFMTTRAPTCPPLISPPFGLAQGSCTNAVPGAQACYFSCFRGYVLTGIPVLTCLPGGRWSNPPPTCRGIVPYRVCGFRRVPGCRCRTCFA